MKLKRLTIELNYYGPHDGLYTGEVCYEDQKGAIKLTLDPHVSNELLKAAGDAIQQASVRVAAELQSSIKQSIAEVNATPMLEAGSGNPP